MSACKTRVWKAPIRLRLNLRSKSLSWYSRSTRKWEVLWQPDTGWGRGGGCYPEMTKSNVRTISGEIYSAFIILRILKLDIFRFSHHHPRNLNRLARNRLTSGMHEMRHIFPIILASFYFSDSLAICYSESFREFYYDVHHWAAKWRAQVW